MKCLLYCTPVLLFLGLLLFLWRGLSLDPHHLPSPQLGRPLPAFHLPQLQDSEQFVDAKQLHGQVALLNVWASWCPSCIEEQVFLMELARNGVPIYGLNYKDRKEEAIDWLAKWGNPYRWIAQDRVGKTAIDLGVYGAPETFVIDKKGKLRYRHVGVITQDNWQRQLQPLMQQLEHENESS